MSIEWDAAARQFHLHNGRASYVVRVLDNGQLGLVHFGPQLRPGRDYRWLQAGARSGFTSGIGDPVALELPTPGSGDFRAPALAVSHANGSAVLELRYVEHRITSGKPAIPGLPATYAEDADEAETLEIRLRDEPSLVEAIARYTIFRDQSAIARSLTLENGGATPVTLTCAMSASVDLPGDDWELVTLSGSWARERHAVRRRVVPGRQGVGSLRGASGHEHNPFLILQRADATEARGEAYAFSLVYSGNFLAEAEVGQFGTTRVRIGIHPEAFNWRLEPGERFDTPEAVLVYSEAGIGALSDALHWLYRERLARGAWRDRLRPVLINNWEGTYFDFDEQRLLAMASAARDLGVELFVLDDGWFGQRDADTSSLGDWRVDRRKLPNGLDGLGRAVTDLGMAFGLWIEPEMVSRRSQLFDTHPDWAIGVPDRVRSEFRNQYVLDMSRPEVVDHLFAALSDVLRGAPITYVKWDMNRNITEPFSPSLPRDRQGEFFHRYILGVYDLYRRLTTAFPGILFESCAGGGGRFDPGMLAFAPQGWTSDDTDAVERLRIQWATSLAYPLSSMAAHVSAVPNHQTGRVTPLATRAAVAFFGVFGYELDPTALSNEERVAVAAQVAFYKRHRELFQRGRFVRLRGLDDGDGNELAWLVVADDRREAIVGHYRILSRPNPGPGLLRLRGLDETATYRIAQWPEDDMAGPPETCGGDVLIVAGLPLPGGRSTARLAGDFDATLFVLDRVNP